MSDDPKKKSEAADKKKGSSSGSSKPTLFSLQNSEPSSNPITLSALCRSSGNDKETKIGPRAVLPGAVAQSTSARNGKSVSPQNTLTEFISGRKSTKGTNYRRRTVSSPRFTSEPRVATTKKVSSSPADNTAKNQSNASATTASLQHSEPSALPSLVKSSKPNKTMKKENKAMIPGAVAVTAAPDEGFKGNKYQCKVAASSVYSRTKGYKNSSSSSTSNESASNEGSSSLSDTFVNNEVVVTTFISLENSEPSAFPDLISAYHSSNSSKGQQSSDAEAQNEAASQESERVASTFTSLENSESSALPDVIPEIIAGSHSLNEAHNEAATFESEHDSLEIPQDNARYISQENSNTTDTQELVVATLVESNRIIFGTDVIVDAIVVDNEPTTWYKDRRILLIIGIFVVVAIVMSGAVNSQLSGDGNNVLFVLQSAAPSSFDSKLPTRALSLSPSSPPSTMPSEAPTFSPSLRILKALYDSTDGPNWFNSWDFNSELSYCEFYGITCDDSEKVITQMDLYYNGLRESLPSEIGILSSLAVLGLHYNSITGMIPSEIGVLSSLQWLWLHSNLITGTIPSEVGMLSSLSHLLLFYNSITGTIPSEVGMLSSLTYFYLFSNSVTGTILSEVGMLSSLTYLSLGGNSINGTIPSEIGMLSSLKYLGLHYNSITGTVPSEIGMLSSLTFLYLHGNSITGMIPTELCALTNTEIEYDEFEISCTCNDSVYKEGTFCN